MTAAAPGVLRRPREQVPFTPPAISVLRSERNRGAFIVDAVMAAYREVDERKFLLRRVR